MSLRNPVTIPKTNYKPWLVSGILLVSDVLSIVIAFAVAIAIRISLIQIIGGEVNFNSIAPILLIFIFLIIGLFATSGFYPGIGRTGVVELKEILRLVTISFVLLGLAIFVLGYSPKFSRSIFIIAWFFCYILISFFRVVIHNRGSLLAWWGKPVVVVGSKKDTANIILQLNRARRMAIKPIAGLVLDPNFRPSKINKIPSFPYSSSNLSSILKSGIHLAMYSSPSVELKPNQMAHLQTLSLAFPKLIYVMGESPLSSLSMKTFDLEGHPAFQVEYNLLDPASKKIKRIVDLALCFISLLITIPIFLVIAILIHLDSSGPIIYVQERMGKNGRIFKLLKFRTMEIDADQRLIGLFKSNPQITREYRKYHKIQADPRITRIGSFLRKTSLDEFPQIWNVIRGEMSLVGPRAYLPEEKRQMGGSEKLIHRVAPGLTGWWQVMGRHDVTFKERLRLDKYYISNYSPWMDFYIGIKTIWIVIGGKGA
jgi:Undecaprenyl-phosphate galactose phosphotransferase WbaP